MEQLIKVHSHDEAPEDSVFVGSKIERNGIIDLKVRDYFILNSNEKEVHLYKVIGDDAFRFLTTKK